MASATKTIVLKRNFERYAYLFMRLSGIGLLFLAVGHVLIQLILNDVHNLTLEFVREQWSSWGWRAYDSLLLILAVPHGYNGLRNILEDYIHNEVLMKWITRLLLVFVVITVVWSLIAIITFQV
ncbi:MAG: succinate dehydrogenase / fumarate reductase membrane anchor subunit [Cellvibrionaceae bacterium]|jgi:succinate dehydrogenase / fumarate reductase membrane anchor subunit